MRGTANEKAAFLELEAKPFVKGVFQLGMVARKEESWLACIADGIAIIDHTVLGLDGLVESNAFGASLRVFNQDDCFLQFTGPGDWD